MEWLSAGLFFWGVGRKVYWLERISPSSMRARAVSTSLLQEGNYEKQEPGFIKNPSSSAPIFFLEVLPYVKAMPSSCTLLLLSGSLNFIRSHRDQTQIYKFALPYSNRVCPSDLDFNPHLSPQATEVLKTWSVWNGRKRRQDGPLRGSCVITTNQTENPNRHTQRGPFDG